MLTEIMDFVTFGTTNGEKFYPAPYNVDDPALPMTGGVVTVTGTRADGSRFVENLKSYPLQFQPSGISGYSWIPTPEDFPAPKFIPKEVFSRRMPLNTQRKIRLDD